MTYMHSFKDTRPWRLYYRNRITTKSKFKYGVNRREISSSSNSSVQGYCSLTQRTSKVNTPTCPVRIRPEHSVISASTALYIYILRLHFDDILMTTWCSMIQFLSMNLDKLWFAICLCQLSIRRYKILCLIHVLKNLDNEMEHWLVAIGLFKTGSTCHLNYNAFLMWYIKLSRSKLTNNSWGIVIIDLWKSDNIFN